MVPFYGLYLESYKVILFYGFYLESKRNYLGAYGCTACVVGVPLPASFVGFADIEATAAARSPNLSGFSWLSSPASLVTLFYLCLHSNLHPGTVP